MSNPVDVCWYTSAMVGAPALSGQAGKLIEVLDACLLTGFGSKTLSSLVVASGVATATVSAGHEFLDYAVVLVAGSTPSGLNGKKRITVVNSTTITFDATGISDQTATGTITAKMAPPGSWSKGFSGTNKASYQSTAIDATGHYLRIDDSPAQYPTLIVYETMSDVDTGTGPSTGSHWFCKSSQADSNACPWVLFADDRAFYLFVANYVGGGSLHYGAMFFGDIVSVLPTDAYHSLIVAHYNNSSFGSSYVMMLGSNYRSGSLARRHDQTGSAIVTTRRSHAAVGDTLGYQSSPVDAPDNQPQYNFLCAPVEVWTHSESILRGMMPGLYSPLHKGTNLTNHVHYPSVVGGEISGRTLKIVRVGNDAAALDITGPWR